MFKFHEVRALGLEALDGAWGDIPTLHLTTLAINLEGTKVLTAKEQFESIFYGRYLIQLDEKQAKNAFLMIFMNNLFILDQINNYQSKLRLGVSDLDIWADVTEFTTENTSEGESEGENVSDVKSYTASTDSNSLMDSSKLTDFMEVEESHPIPANAMSQNKGHDSATNSAKFSNTGETKSKTSISNASKDYIGYLHLEIPSLRESFWLKFSPLFRL